jgi:bla regulator protein BlaR1
LKWSSASTEFSLTTDKVDLPFVDDPAVSGTWKSVDFVSSINAFTPTKTNWPDTLVLKSITFLDDGGIVRSWSDNKTSDWPGTTWTMASFLIAIR